MELLLLYFIADGNVVGFLCTLHAIQLLQVVLSYVLSIVDSPIKTTNFVVFSKLMLLDFSSHS